MEKSLRSIMIEARERCRYAIMSIAEYVLPYYQKAIESKEIEDVESEINIWNNGLILNIKPIFDETKAVDKKKLIYNEFIMFSQPEVIIDDIQIKYSNETGINIDWNNIIYHEVKSGESPDIEQIKKVINEKCYL